MVNYTKYKPLYKKFIRLRKNVQNRTKLNLGLLKKKKWNPLNNYLRRLSRRRKKNFRLYNLDSYHIRRYGSFFKKKFLLDLLSKQRLSLFYGNLTTFYLKKLISSCSNYSLKEKKINSDLLIIKLEKRLDTVLYRSKFTKSLRQSRILIQHGHIYINGIVNYNNNYILKKGDIITVSKNVKKIVYFNVISSNMWPLPAEYLIVNYRILHIIYFNDLQINKLYNSFPFYLNSRLFNNYYKIIKI